MAPVSSRGEERPSAGRVRKILLRKSGRGYYWTPIPRQSLNLARFFSRDPPAPTAGARFYRRQKVEQDHAVCASTLKRLPENRAYSSAASQAHMTDWEKMKPFLVPTPPFSGEDSMFSTCRAPLMRAVISIAFFLLVSTATIAQTAKIGLIGLQPDAPLTDLVLRSAEEHAQWIRDNYGETVEIVTYPDTCTPSAVRKAAEKLLHEDVTALTGFLCPGTVDAVAAMDLELPLLVTSESIDPSQEASFFWIATKEVVRPYRTASMCGHTETDSADSTYLSSLEGGTLIPDLEQAASIGPAQWQDAWSVGIGVAALGSALHSGSTDAQSTIEALRAGRTDTFVLVPDFTEDGGFDSHAETLYLYPRTHGNLTRLDATFFECNPADPDCPPPEDPDDVPSPDPSGLLGASVCP